MLLFEIWLAKMQAGNLGFSTLVSFWLVVFFVGLFFFFVGFFFPRDENLKKAFIYVTKQVFLS